MMKCQACDEPATCHVTEMVAGNAVEYHVCQKHASELDTLKPVDSSQAALESAEILQAFQDPLARQKMAAYLLPALCLALLDPNPEVRILAAFRMMNHGSEAKSALGALRTALQDSDKRVRKVAAAAIEYIQGVSNDPFPLD
jgi:HEAT repeat protein